MNAAATDVTSIHLAQIRLGWTVVREPSPLDVALLRARDLYEQGVAALTDRFVEGAAT